MRSKTMIGGKALSDLSEDELRREVETRRQRRMVHEKDGAVRAVDAGQIARWYANLELNQGASVEEIDRAYQKLRAQFEPKLNVDDADKRGTAERLLGALELAREGLKAFWEGRL